MFDQFLGRYKTNVYINFAGFVPSKEEMINLMKVIQASNAESTGFIIALNEHNPSYSIISKL